MRRAKNWDAFLFTRWEMPVQALLAFVSLLEGRITDGIEHWEQDLLP